ncbi:MAG TPA: PEP-CTERM sorting domain-containing protein [Roseiarcus sp.]|nr:PEP-CTERM sorting domain-containing protein [Roseiarcus sp.]
MKTREKSLLAGLGLGAAVALVPAQALAGKGGGGGGADPTCGVASGSVVGVPQSTCFLPGNEDGDEVKMFEDKLTDTTAFFGSLGKNDGSKDIKITTSVPVDTSNGYGEISPTTKGGAFTSVLFEGPDSEFAFDGVFIRGQIVGAPHMTYDGVLYADVTDALGNQVTFQWSNLGSGTPDDLQHLGVDEAAGYDGVALASVRFYLDDTGYFKSIKQIDFSDWSAAGATGGGASEPAVPEPTTWAMLLIGFAGLGYATFRRSGKGSMSAAV